MKILVVSMSAELGGIEKSLICFLKFLLTLPDVEIDLMLWKCRGQLLGDIPAEVSIIPSPAPGNLRTILGNCKIKELGTYLRLKIMSKKGTPWLSFPTSGKKYDIAIAYSQDGYSPYYVLDRVNANRKYMWYHHGAYIHKGKKKSVDLKYYPRFTNIIAVSDSIREVLEKEVPSCVTNIKVINNLIDVDYIIRSSNEDCITFGRTEDCCKLLTVGRLSDEKGQLRVLDIANELKQKGFRFEWIFVGDGPQKEDCIQKVNQLDLGKCCKFVGAKTNPYPYFRDADIYIAPSYVEADPITIQEAMILGKSIIASDIPAISQILQNKRNCLILPFSEVQYVACKIISSHYDEPQPIEDKAKYSRNEKITNQLTTLLYEQ